MQQKLKAHLDEYVNVHPIKVVQCCWTTPVSRCAVQWGCCLFILPLERDPSALISSNELDHRASLVMKHWWAMKPTVQHGWQIASLPPFIVLHYSSVLDCTVHTPTLQLKDDRRNRKGILWSTMWEWDIALLAVDLVLQVCITIKGIWGPLLWSCGKLLSLGLQTS